MKRKNYMWISIFAVITIGLALLAGMGYFGLTISDSTVYTRDIKDLDCVFLDTVVVTKDYTTLNGIKEMIINCPVGSGATLVSGEDDETKYVVPGTATNCIIKLTPMLKVQEDFPQWKYLNYVFLDGHSVNNIFQLDYKATNQDSLFELSRCSSKGICEKISSATNKMTWNQPNNFVTLQQGEYAKVVNKISYAQTSPQILTGDKTYFAYKFEISEDIHVIKDSSSAQKTSISQGCCPTTPLKATLLDSDVSNLKNGCLSPGGNVIFTYRYISALTDTVIVEHPLYGEGVCQGNTFSPVTYVKFADGNSHYVEDETKTYQVACCPGTTALPKPGCNSDFTIATEFVQGGQSCDVRYYGTTSWAPNLEGKVCKSVCIDGKTVPSECKVNTCLDLPQGYGCDPKTYERVKLGDYDPGKNPLVGEDGNPLVGPDDDKNKDKGLTANLWVLLLVMVPVILTLFYYTKRKDSTDAAIGFSLGSFFALLIYLIVDYVQKNLAGIILGGLFAGTFGTILLVLILIIFAILGGIFLGIKGMISSGGGLKPPF